MRRNEHHLLSPSRYEFSYIKVLDSCNGFTHTRTQWPWPYKKKLYKNQILCIGQKRIKRQPSALTKKHRDFVERDAFFFLLPISILEIAPRLPKWRQIIIKTNVFSVVFVSFLEKKFLEKQNRRGGGHRHIDDSHVLHEFLPIWIFRFHCFSEQTIEYFLPMHLRHRFGIYALHSFRRWRRIE